LVEQSRVMTHPGLESTEGIGIFTYPSNPTLTINYIFDVATKVDVSISRTLGSSVAIPKAQKPEDVVMQEIWVGGRREATSLTEMARLFHSFWVTPLPEGKLIGWEPLDRSQIRHEVRIVNVQIGGVDYRYNEVREFVTQNDPSYLDTQLTVSIKEEKLVKPPKSLITLEGL